MSESRESWRPMVFANPSTRLRSARSMPQWMTQKGGGPPPPPIPSATSSGTQHGAASLKSLQQPPEPDYEVIEYRGGVGNQPQQEYSNTPPMLPQKQVIGGAKGRSGHCDLCGAVGPRVKCDKCAQQIFCLSCDDMYHRHPKRQSHVRKALDVNVHTEQQIRPPLPPKGEPLLAPPVPPPRRNKRGGSVANSPCPSPLPQRHGSFNNDQVGNNVHSTKYKFKRCIRYRLCCCCFCCCNSKCSCSKCCKRGRKAHQNGRFDDKNNNGYLKNIQVY